MSNPERLLDAALHAITTSKNWRAVLDGLLAPIYVTDADGAVSYWNSACVELAGRVPQLGQDRWCVTWQLYSMSGEFMRHDECPMAKAIRARHLIRDQVAIALRPDGSRVAFRAYPTPLFDSKGEVTGAINMLVDISSEQVGALNDEARRCRRLADATFNREVSEMLDNMADGYEQTAGELAKSRKT